MSLHTHSQQTFALAATELQAVKYKKHTVILTLRHKRHTFNGLLSRTTWVSRHQKGKPFWILLKQEMTGGSGISWTIRKSFAPHSRHTTTPVPITQFFMGRMLFLTPNQQCQSTEGSHHDTK